MEYIINLIWDDDAKVWVATSDDIAGLVLESGSFDALLERVRYAVPELLELNGTEKGRSVCRLSPSAMKGLQYNRHKLMNHLL